MQDWSRSGKVPLERGAREPRDNPNFKQAEARDSQRTLVVLEGGDPSSVTHQGDPRRGSRIRGGSLRPNDRRAIQADSDLHAFHLDPKGEDLDTSSTGANQDPAQASEMQHIATPSAEEPGPAAPQPPHRWSEASFTKEALAKNDKEFGAKERPSSEEILAASKDLKATYRRTHGLGGPKDRHRPIDGGTAQASASRGRLPNSHQGGSPPPKSRKK